MYPRRGVLITFEGVEGCGKSTLLDGLAARLEEAGLPVRRSREPGGTPLGEDVRRLVLDARHRRVNPWSELFLMLAARAQLVQEVLRPAMESRQIVLCDRYGDASTAYQGVGRGLGLETVERLNELATGGLVPDVTFLVDLDPAEGQRRMGDRARDRLEREKTAFHESVREGYLELARRHRGRFEVLDGALPPASLLEEAWARLEDFRRRERLW